MPKAFKYNANAAIFYKNYLASLIKKLNIQGIIIYSMFSTLIEPIAEVAKELKVFVINDGGEKYSVNFQNIINGINYMQYRAIFYSFKKLMDLWFVLHAGKIMLPLLENHLYFYLHLCQNKTIQR